MIESSPDVADLLARELQPAAAEGIDRASDGKTGLSMAESLDYALIIMDLVSSKLGGPELCKALRTIRPDTPLLAVTARVDAIDALLGKAAGIDDYSLKPVFPRDLLRKVHTLLARSRAFLESPNPVASDRADISFDTAKRSVLVEGRRITRLSLAEFELLSFLAEHRGMSFSEEQLLALLWRLYPPARLKHLSVDLGLLRRRIRGASSRVQYLKLDPAGRVRLDPGSDAW